MHIATITRLCRRVDAAGVRAWCVAAALMLSPALLSMALVFAHTEGLRQRLVNQAEARSRVVVQAKAQGRIEERLRLEERLAKDQVEAQARLEELNRRLRLVEQDNTGLRSPRQSTPMCARGPRRTG